MHVRIVLICFQRSGVMVASFASLPCTPMLAHASFLSQSTLRRKGRTWARACFIVRRYRRPFSSTDSSSSRWTIAGDENGLRFPPVVPFSLRPPTPAVMMPRPAAGRGYHAPRCSAACFILSSTELGQSYLRSSRIPCWSWMVGLPIRSMLMLILFVGPHPMQMLVPSI